MVSRAKSKWHKHQKSKKCVLNSQLQTYQVLTNEAEVWKRSCFSFIIAVLIVLRHPVKLWQALIQLQIMFA